MTRPSVETVNLLLSHRSISPNGVHPVGTGTTPLHLAASLGRGDIVSLLLEQDEIDDTARDSHGKTAKDVAINRETARIITDAQTLLNASFLSLLRSYILSSPSTSTSAPPELLAILTSPRVRNVDLTHLDAASGTTLLHEAAKRKDLRLVELAIRGGADPFVRDRKGRGVAEHANKDDPIKVFLRQFTNRDMTLLDDAPSSGSSTLRSNSLPNLKVCKFLVMKLVLFRLTRCFASSPCRHVYSTVPDTYTYSRLNDQGYLQKYANVARGVSLHGYCPCVDSSIWLVRGKVVHT